MFGTWIGRIMKTYDYINRVTIALLYRYASFRLSLYCIRCKRHTIALLYRYAVAIVGETTVGVKTGGSRVGGLELCV